MGETDETCGPGSLEKSFLRYCLVIGSATVFSSKIICAPRGRRARANREKVIGCRCTHPFVLLAGIEPAHSGHLRLSPPPPSDVCQHGLQEEDYYRSSAGPKRSTQSLPTELERGENRSSSSLLKGEAAKVYGPALYFFIILV